MSVIFGVNLSDRLYIAGDSRLSQKKVKGGVESVIFVHDNMQKVENIRYSQQVVVASAGDAKFANFILTKLFKEEFTKGGIISIRSNIEEWIRQKTDEWLRQQNPYPLNAFIIGGADPSNKKKIYGKDLMALITKYTAGQGSGSLKGVIYDALMAKPNIPNPEPILNIADTVMFAVEVDQEGVRVIDSKWGEFLIYGPKGLIKSDVPDRTIAQLEFDANSTQPLHGRAIITMLIEDLAENKGLATVGGVILVMMVGHDNATYTGDGPITATNLGTGETKHTSHIKVTSNRLYRVDEKGTIYKLIPVSEYKSKGDFLL